jgi:hypothetical protein
MGAQSDLYNTFVPARLDRGDERYYPLEAGGYLICVSTTRNELLDYEVGLVVEFPITEMFISLEDEADVALFLQETAIDFSRTINVISPVAVNTTISSSIDQPNGFTEEICVINSGVTVTVLFGSEWFIGTQIPSEQGNEFLVIAEPGDDYTLIRFMITLSRSGEKAGNLPTRIPISFHRYSSRLPTGLNAFLQLAYLQAV